MNKFEKFVAFVVIMGICALAGVVGAIFFKAPQTASVRDEESTARIYLGQTAQEYFGGAEAFFVANGKEFRLDNGDGEKVLATFDFGKFLDGKVIVKIVTKDGDKFFFGDVQVKNNAIYLNILPKEGGCYPYLYQTKGKKDFLATKPAPVCK